jgi:hypothetical protein
VGDDMSAAVYATIQDRDGAAVRIGAQVSTDAESGRPYVSVWRSGGLALGGFWLDRFEGGKLTARTLVALLTVPSAVAS